MEKFAKKIGWSDWMEKYSIYQKEGSSTWALFDTNAGLPQLTSSKSSDPMELLNRLKKVVGEVVLDLDDFDFCEIENSVDGMGD